MPIRQLQLVTPTLELIPSFLEMIDESLHCAGDRTSGYYLGSSRRFDEIRDYPQEFLHRLAREERSEGLPEGLVPQTTFWLVDGHNQVVGEARLRHWLNAALKIEGGHIGYFIRPSARRLGYGARILKLALAEARKIGLRQVLVTCNRDNIGSARIIVKNGGMYAGEGMSAYSGKAVSRYWIDL